MPSWTIDQKSAIEKEGTNIIVSAGAGSGKTAVLSERVLRKLKDGVNINELLILTFTNAAALEMKERIRKKIKKEHSLKEQLDYIDNADITTFDAYALLLVKKYHYLLNVSSNINIIDAGIISLESERILDELFDELYEENNESFINLINDFCMKDDKEIKEAIKKINKLLNLKSNKIEYLNCYIENNFNKTLIDSYIDEFLKLSLNKVDKIEELIYFIEGSEYQEFYEKLVEVLEPLIRSKTYDDLKANINIKLPRRPSKSDDLKPIKDEMDLLIKEIGNLLTYKNLDEIYEIFDMQKNNIEAIIKILLEYDKRIIEYKIINNTYEFSDVSLMAIKIVKENDDIRSELKEFYNEIMVDEYQDTNDLQEDFINMIENNNVYMVGDIKQSIYRFRNANPSIFKNKYDKYSLNKNGFKIDLLKNFRSRPEVLNGINEIFNLIMDDYLGGANYSLNHQMEFGNQSYLDNKSDQNYDLEILNYDSEDKTYSKEEYEAFIIARDIQNKINNYQVFDKETLKLRKAKYSDFCIIMDRGTAFDTYKKIFEYLSVPLTIYADEKLTSEYDVMVIKNILGMASKIYHKNYDNEFKHYFVSIARSFLFEMSDDNIFEIVKNKKYYETDIFIKCKEISLCLDKMSNLEVLNKILNDFNFYEKSILIGNVESTIVRIDNLKDIASNLSKLGYTPFMFKEYIDNMIKSKDEIKYSINKKIGDNVQLMNIHKSKGLEYPICYFSGYHKEFNTQDIKEKFTYDNKYGIIIPYFKEGIGQSIMKDLLVNKYKEENISEQIRLFYVALTRAREKMIIVTSFKEDNDLVTGIVPNDIRTKYNSFFRICASVKGNLSSYIKDVDLPSLNLSKDYNQIRKLNYQSLIDSTNEIINVNEINVDNELIFESNASKKVNKLLTKEEVSKMEYGTLIHSVFENADFKNIDDSLYSEKVFNFISKFDVNNAVNIYKELEFIFNDNNQEYHGIIDIVLEYDDVIKIIDYKLKNITDEAYTKQLGIYESYIKSISDKPVKKYLYSIIDNKEVQIN